MSEQDQRSLPRVRRPVAPSRSPRLHPRRRRRAPSPWPRPGPPAVPARADDAKNTEQSPSPPRTSSASCSPASTRSRKPQWSCPGTTAPKGGADRLKRLGMYNAADRHHRIGEIYTRPQQELVERILQAICLRRRRLSPAQPRRHLGRQRLVRRLRRRHLRRPGRRQAVRLGLHRPPPDGPLRRQLRARRGLRRPDVLRPQPQRLQRHATSSTTRPSSVLSVFDALTEAAAQGASSTGNPGEQEPSVRFRKRTGHPGIAAGDLTADQQAPGRDR